jgi:hypothetical protein
MPSAARIDLKHAAFVVRLRLPNRIPPSIEQHHFSTAVTDQ